MFDLVPIRLSHCITTGLICLTIFIVPVFGEVLNYNSVKWTPLPPTGGEELFVDATSLKKEGDRSVVDLKVDLDPKKERTDGSTWGVHSKVLINCIKHEVGGETIYVFSSDNKLIKTIPPQPIFTKFSPDSRYGVLFKWICAK